jgi:hypothetical protein
MRLRQFQINRPHNRNSNFRFTSRRFYSTSSSSKVDIPIPIIILTDLQDKNYLHSKLLSRKGGIYSFVNKVNGTNT